MARGLFAPSSAVTVKLNEVPAVAFAGAVMEKCGLGAAPTSIDAEVPIIDAATVSVAVMVCVPAVFIVAEKVPVPLASVALAGDRTAWKSLLVRCTVPV